MYNLVTAQEIPKLLDLGFCLDSNSYKQYSLEELCKTAISQSPKIQAKRYSVQAEKENLKLNKISLLPGVSLTSSFDKSGGTDLFTFGANFSWSADLSTLLGRDIALARNGLLRAKEFKRREQVWVLNGIEDLYRSIAVLSKREQIYMSVIDACSELESNLNGFGMEKDLKIAEYQFELTRIQNKITEQTSRLSALAFGDPYNGFIEVEMNYLNYDPLFVDRSAALRKAVKERMQPEIFNLHRQEILVKLASRNWQPQIFTSYNQRRVQGTAASYTNPNSSSFSLGMRILFDLPGRSAAKSRARSYKAVAQANAIVGLNELINSTYRALDRFEQARDNLTRYIKKYGENEIDFLSALKGSYPNLQNLDRNVFQILDLHLGNSLKLVDYLSEYRSAIINLNNHLMYTPLDDIDYLNLDPDNTMPEIFSLLSVPEGIYKKHEKNLLSNLIE